MLMIGCIQNDNDPNKWETSMSQTVWGEGPALSFSEDITGWDGVLCAWYLLPPQDAQHWVSTTLICHFSVWLILSWIDNKQLTDTQLRDHTLNSTWSQAEPSPVKAIVLGRVPRWHSDTSPSATLSFFLCPNSQKTTWGSHRLRTVGHSTSKVGSRGD